MPLPAPTSPLVLLKLGGSVITEKSRPHTARPAVLARLAGEIAAARQAVPGLRLILGHGSGSFGHVPARLHGTRQGVNSPAGWQGFAEVWRQAAALNRLVMDALAAADVPALAFAPSAAVLSQDGRVAAWNLAPLEAALQAGLLPVIFGDVVFDTQRGGTILSTEDLFTHLLLHLRPQRILLAGIEPGVWADYPACTRLIEAITPAGLVDWLPVLRGSAAADVTGGMASKVQAGLDWVQTVPGLEVVIFSGEAEQAVYNALTGKAEGTRLVSD